MPSMVIVKAAEISGAALPAAGQRAGADSGDPQLGLRMLAPEAGAAPESGNASPAAGRWWIAPIPSSPISSLAAPA